MSKKEKRGDWPVEVDVLDEDEAKAIKHDIPDGPPGPDHEKRYREQVAKERKEGHPSDRHRPDDPDLD